VCCDVLSQYSHILQGQHRVNSKFVTSRSSCITVKSVCCCNLLQCIVAVQPHVVQAAKGQQQVCDTSILLNHNKSVCSCSVLQCTVAVQPHIVKATKSHTLSRQQRVNNMFVTRRSSCIIVKSVCCCSVLQCTVAVQPHVVQAVKRQQQVCETSILLHHN